MVSALHPSVFHTSDSPEALRGTPSTKEGSVEEILASIRRIIADDQGPEKNPFQEKNQSLEKSATIAVQHPHLNVWPQLSPMTDAYLRDRNKQRKLDRTLTNGEAGVMSVTPPHTDMTIHTKIIEDILETENSMEAHVNERGASEADINGTHINGAHMNGTHINVNKADFSYQIEDTKEEREETKETDVQAPSITSSEVRAQVSTSFQALTTALLAQNTGLVERGVHDMLRPMLKEWLDVNLPALVEKLVIAEIERIARSIMQPES